MTRTAQAFSVAIIGALTLGGAAEFARAECYVQEPLPPVHRHYIQRDAVEPGVYEIGRSAAEYGWVRQAVVSPDNPSEVTYVERRVLLKPYKNYSHFQRPYIAFKKERLTIQPEGYRLVPVAPSADCCQQFFQFFKPDC